LTSLDADREVAAIARIDVVPTILEVVCRTTGMGFAAVARVSEDRWIACEVRDEIQFGLQPGGELKVETTICHEIRESGRAVVIDDVAADEAFCGHPTPAMYGFRSYISMPIRRPNGAFFGTLCAIDPRPAKLNTPETIGMFRLFADLIGFHLDAQDRLATSETALVTRARDQDPGADREQRAAHGRPHRRCARFRARAPRRRHRAQPLERPARPRPRAGRRRAARRLAGSRDRGRDRRVRPGRLRPRAHRPTSVEPPRHALSHGAPDRPVRVRASIEGGRFELFVANAGDPIPAATQERLFQPFVRASARPTHQGLGLGLYIASEIARAHGGTLEVSSTPEETRFTFRMAAAAGEHAPAPPARSTARASAGS
jgi:GAF domain-containing protein